MTERQCNGCTMCCKLMAIDELQKPVNVWCHHCDIGVGCKIYETKPVSCTGFKCGYLTGAVGEEWNPSKCKMVVYLDNGGNRFNVAVDPGKVDAWRKEPFYGQIRQMAWNAVPYHGQVIVKVGNRMIVVLPLKEVDLGIVGPDQLIVTDAHATTAFLIHKDDPRAK